MSSACVLGFSGSGKTTLVKHLASKDKKPIYIVNCKATNEYQDVGGKPIGWSPKLFEKLKHCSLVFEDLVGAKQRELTSCREVLHYQLRRNQISLYILAHEVHNTGVFSLLGNMDKVYITSGAKNKKTVKDFLRHHPLENFDPEQFLRKKHHYLEINVEARSHQVLGPNFEPAKQTEEDKLSEKRKGVSQLLPAAEGRETLMSIFDIIFKNIDPERLTGNDYTLMIKDAGSKKGKSRRVSIVDFLLSLRNQDKPHQDIVLLKRYMDSNFVIPRMLITNQHLR